MRCSEARRMMLEAEPDALGPADDTPLGEHLRSCPRCAARAAAILSFESALSDGLEVLPGVDASEIVRRGRRRERASTTASSGKVRTWTGRKAWIALATAATVAAFVLWPRAPERLPGTPFVAGPVDLPTVEAPEGRDVAILPTSNPDITVLWFF